MIGEKSGFVRVLLSWNPDSLGTRFVSPFVSVRRRGGIWNRGAPRARTFPGRYSLEALMREKVPQDRTRWYVGWVERFRAFQKNRPLAGRGPEDAEAFLRGLSDRPGVQLWQGRQGGPPPGVFFRARLGAGRG